MKQWVFLIGAVLVVAYILFRMAKLQERFQPEFLDYSQTAKTLAVETSSYAQTTNHADPLPTALAPAPGMETPFQVNQYKARVL